MELGINGRTALICGASAGIGLACARRLAQEGALVTISARGEERLRAAAAELEGDLGATVSAVVADHATLAGREALFAACPQPDILVTNASPPPLTPDFTEIEPEAWDASLAVALLAPVELMRHYVPGMRERGFGRVVHIGTAGAKYPIIQRLLSGGPRAALINYSVAVAREVVKDGVTVNTLLPGLFATPEVIKRLGPGVSEPHGTAGRSLPVAGRIPAERAGRPDEIAAMCAFLASESAGYIVGQTICVDGGIDRTLF